MPEGEHIEDTEDAAASGTGHTRGQPRRRFASGLGESRGEPATQAPQTPHRAALAGVAAALDTTATAASD